MSFDVSTVAVPHGLVSAYRLSAVFDTCTVVPGYMMLWKLLMLTYATLGMSS